MMTPEEAYAYEKALRRIREAEETGALKLDLSELELNRLPPELTRLTSLQALDLARCKMLIDLSPLACLTSLRSLNLWWCQQLSGDLSPLASLTSLQELNLFGCEKLSGNLSPLASHTCLQSLDLIGVGSSTAI
jgi:Leucine-rich repeat (LRR) protein